jgi:Domain of unknown function (DUF4178)
MSHPTSTCPQCGAKIEFRWSGAVQAVCDFCRSVLVRTDVDLHRVGTAADLADDASPIQINTEGVWNKRAFTVVGRIVYEYAQGGWSEWHLLFSDGTSGWLSDAQLEWAISVQRPPVNVPSDLHAIRPGSKFAFEGVSYEVTTITKAHYKSVEGQLPFVYWDKEDVVFVDLRTASRSFASIDYSESTPLLYLGQFIEFEDLRLTGLRQFEGWA